MFFKAKTQKVSAEARTYEFGLHPTRGGLVTLDVDVIGSDGKPEIFLYLTNLMGGSPGNAIVKGVDGELFPVAIPEGGMVPVRGVAVVSSGNVPNGAGGTTSMSTTSGMLLAWSGGA